MMNACPRDGRELVLRELPHDPVHDAYVCDDLQCPFFLLVDKAGERTLSTPWQSSWWTDALTGLNSVPSRKAALTRLRESVLTDDDGYYVEAS